MRSLPLTPRSSPYCAQYGLERGVKGSERTHLSEQKFKLERIKVDLASAEKDRGLLDAAIAVAGRHPEELSMELQKAHTSQQVRLERGIAR